jgi:hypothetical protein
MVLERKINIKMKNILVIILVVLTDLNCSSKNQNTSNIWLPEKYVNAVIAKDTNTSKYLIPVEGIESIDESFYILMYKGELNSVKTIKVNIEGKEKYQLFNLQYFVNLKYNSIELANRLTKATVYVSKSGEKLLLEIIEDDKTDEIYFIDRVDRYQFKSIYEAKKYLQKK